MAKQKYYVVWTGKKPGIYHSWPECQEQVNGFPAARYKAFSSEQEARQAFEAGSQAVLNKSKAGGAMTGGYIEESISVDAACSGNPGDMEYQGVCTKTGEQLFHFGPIAHGTNNIGEFLAIVHALAYLKERQSTMPIYSDSQTAISWVRNRQVNTNVERHEETAYIWQLIDRALSWLAKHQYSNKVLKWDTKQWGESKADFGRK